MSGSFESPAFMGAALDELVGMLTSPLSSSSIAPHQLEQLQSALWSKLNEHFESDVDGSAHLLRFTSSPRNEVRSPRPIREAARRAGMGILELEGWILRLLLTVGTTELTFDVRPERIVAQAKDGEPMVLWPLSSPIMSVGSNGSIQSSGSAAAPSPRQRCSPSDQFIMDDLASSPNSYRSPESPVVLRRPRIPRAAPPAPLLPSSSADLRARHHLLTLASPRTPRTPAQMREFVQQEPRWVEEMTELVDEFPGAPPPPHGHSSASLPAGYRASLADQPLALPQNLRSLSHPLAFRAPPPAIYSPEQQQLPLQPHHRQQASSDLAFAPFDPVVVHGDLDRPDVRGRKEDDADMDLVAAIYRSLHMNMSQLSLSSASASSSGASEPSPSTASAASNLPSTRSSSPTTCADEASPKMVPLVMELTPDVDGYYDFPDLDLPSSDFESAYSRAYVDKSRSESARCVVEYECGKVGVLGGGVMLGLARGSAVMAN